jgi:hypothetical protein
MGNQCAPCCFQKGGENDSVLQTNIKDGKGGYRLDNSIRGSKANNNALPSSRMDLNNKKGAVV